VEGALAGNAHIYLYIYITSAHIYPHIHTLTHTHTHRDIIRWARRCVVGWREHLHRMSIYKYMYVYIYTHTYLHIHTHTHIYKYTHTHTHTQGYYEMGTALYSGVEGALEEDERAAFQMFAAAAEQQHSAGIMCMHICKYTYIYIYAYLVTYT